MRNALGTVVLAGILLLQNGLAVGEVSTKTTVLLPVPEIIGELAQVPGTSTLVAVYDGPDKVMISNDLGQTWGRTILEGKNVNGFFAVDDSTWFIDIDRVLHRSTDAGETWQVFHEATNQYTFHRGTTIGLNFDNFFYITHDLGKTWKYVVLPFHPREIQFVNTETGFAVAEYHDVVTFHVTHDGGETWTEKDIPFLGPTGIHFSDELHGVVSGWKTVPAKSAGDTPPVRYIGLAYVTDDGGETWEEHEFPGSVFTSLVALDDGAMYLFSANHGISTCESYVSYDSGSTWESWPVVSVQSLVQKGDDMICLTSGELVESHDSGATWNTGEVFTAFYITDVKFCTSRKGVIIGYRIMNSVLGDFVSRKAGFVQITDDGGESWQFVDLSPYAVFQPLDVSYMDGNTLYVTGSEVFFWPQSVEGGGKSLLLKSVDGGLNWEVVETGEVAPFDELTIFPDGTGYAINSAAILVKTSDYGKSWEEIPSAGTWVGPVYFVNSMFGFAASFGDFKRTTDGGAHWETVLNQYIRPISFIDENNGIVSDSNNIYLTHDGGDTWDIIYAKDERYFARMYDESRMLTGDRDGNVMITEDGGANWREMPRPYSHSFDTLGFGVGGDVFVHIVNTVVRVSGFWETPIAVGEPDTPVPFTLRPNYPNPFNPSTTIEYVVPDDTRGMVTVGVYDIRGALVRTLAETDARPGRYSIIWDGADGQGNAMSNGVYICRMQCGAAIQSQKMLLLK